jgi:hypothetical protein
VPFSGFEDFDECVRTMTEEEGHDQQAAENICGALQAESKSENGNVDELRQALEAGSGLIADVGVDLVSGVDVPAIDSKWVAMKSADDAHDWQATAPILKADDTDQRITYAAAMIPREPDKEGDVAPTPTVEKAAHDFLTAGGGVDTDHSLIDGEGEVVESWVLKEDRTFDLPGGGTETYPEGSWMVGIKWDAEPWQRIQNGELTGLSIYGMADHVPLARSATAKGFEVPFADEVVVHVVYESQTAAEKASEDMGLGGDIHEHELDGMAVWMPGETHDDFVQAYNEEARGGSEAVQSAKQEDPCWEGYTMVGLDDNGNPRCVPDDDVPDVDFDQSYTPSETRELSAAKSADGDTLNSQSPESEGMGSADNSEDNQDLGDLREEVSALTESVETIKEAVETDKQPGEGIQGIVDEFADRLAAADGVDTDAGSIKSVIREALDAGDDGGAESTDKESAMEAAQMLGEEFGMSAEAVMDMLETADEDEADKAEHGDDEDEEDDEMDKAAESGPDHEDANLGKGGDSRTTAAKGIEEDEQETSAGVPSYKAVAHSED